MTLKEVNEQSIIIDGIKYTPKTRCEKLENGEANYIILKSAQEVYEDLQNKIDICLEPTELQVLQEQVTKLIINQL